MKEKIIDIFREPLNFHSTFWKKVFFFNWVKRLYFSLANEWFRFYNYNIKLFNFEREKYNIKEET